MHKIGPIPEKDLQRSKEFQGVLDNLSELRSTLTFTVIGENEKEFSPRTIDYISAKLHGARTRKEAFKISSKMEKLGYRIAGLKAEYVLDAYTLMRVGKSLRQMFSREPAGSPEV
jgi:hypothetical protein